MIRIDMSAPSSERGIAARIFPIAPRVPVEEDLDEHEEAQAKVVRSPRRKGPRTHVEGVQTK